MTRTMTGLFTMFVVFLIAGFVMFSVVSCASVQTPGVPKVTKEQLCKNGQMGLQIANAAQAVAPLKESLQKYWSAFEAGAIIAIANYCTPEVKPTP